MTCYATLDQAKQNMAAESTIEDTILLDKLRQVSNRIDRKFMPTRSAPVFAPYIETRNNFRMTGDRVNSADGTYYFGEPLLVLSSVGIGTQSLTVPSTVSVWQGGISPYMTLGLADCCCGSWYRYLQCSGCSRNAFVSIAGTWGYNVDYANAWINTLQDAPILTDSATSFVVSDVDAPNALGLIPAISAGNLLQIDSEWLEVTATVVGTNTVTVRRGVNGSTAAAHSAGTAIYSYRVEPQIERATYRQAAFELAKIGAYDNKAVADLATVDFAPDALAEFHALLTLFANF